MASTALREGINRFTQGSDDGTAELAKWSERTANWTRALVFATTALVVAAVVQALVMWKGQ